MFLTKQNTVGEITECRIFLYKKKNNNQCQRQYQISIVKLTKLQYSNDLFRNCEISQIPLRYYYIILNLSTLRQPYDLNYITIPSKIPKDPTFDTLHNNLTPNS
jgi:hypothetical protein